MNVRIEGDNSFYTEITVKDANGEVVFDGNLKMESDWWVLYDTRKDYMGDVVNKWRGTTPHLVVLSKAIAAIAKATGSA